MKKILLALAAVLTGFSVSAQTIVSTDVQKRNVVFEEYTGWQCGYCPLGHQMVAEYGTAHPGQVVPINIHAGSYASDTPNFTTSWGNALMNQTDLTGFPAGTINRSVSSCSVHAITASSNSWYSTANAVLNQDSPVNVAATATVDATTRIMTIHVEAYYTAAVAQNYNMLNIALLQNNIKADQHNYGNYNPSQITADGQYMHMHMLRDLITGQWGDTIALNSDGSIAAGTFVSKDYTYTIPAAVGAFPVEFGDITLAVFVTDGYADGCSSLHSPNIWTGVSVDPEYTNISGQNAAISSIDCENIFGCSSQITPSVTLRNIASPCTSIVLNYKSDVETDYHTYTISDSLGTFEGTTVTLDPVEAHTDGTATTVTVNVVSVDGVALDGVSGTGEYTKLLVKEGAGQPKLTLKTDKYASEVGWVVYDADGNRVQSQAAGYYSDGTALKDTIVLWGIQKGGCYTFEITDSYGDGCSSGNYKIIDADGNTLTSNMKGSWGSGEKKDFRISQITVGLNDADANIEQAILYPNPATDYTTLQVSVNNAADAQIMVSDLMGRTVLSLGENHLSAGSNSININTAALANGTYVVRVITNDGMTSNKLTVSK